MHAKAGLLLLLTALIPFPAAAEGAYAFAQGPNGEWSGGSAFNYSTAAEAQARALEYCGRRASTCTILAAVSNRCFAIAVQHGNNGYSWSYGADQSEANNTALRGCAKLRASCSVQASFCDSVPEVHSTLICIKPIFEEEFRLRSTLDGRDSQTDHAIAAVTYLRRAYCRTTTEQLGAPFAEVSLSGGCYQYLGAFRGEQIYWMECKD